MQILKEGKLTIEQLKELVFEYTEDFRDEVLSHPYIGQDCAIIDSGKQMISVSSDPITAAKEDIGKLAVEINLNDIAASGADPFAITVVILCPVGTTDEDIKLVMKDIYDTSREKNVQIIGGHTEVTSAVNKLVICVTALGLLSRELYNAKSKFEDGDLIYVTKDIAMEGTHIIVVEKPSISASIFDEDDYATLVDYSKNLSVIEDAKIARQYGCIMHDITEGGVLGAVWETCEMINLGAKLEFESMPISDATEKLCNYLEINSLRLISSGSLLIIAKKSAEKELELAYRKAGIKLSKVGELQKQKSVSMKKNSILSEISPPESDELYKII